MDTKSYSAIYLRVSTEEQRERQTIVTQRDFAERYCALHDIPIYGWYADDGVSGTVPLDQRPEGARLLADARNGKIKVVLIYRLDRLGRDPRLTLTAVNDLEQFGVQVQSMTEPFDTATPAGRLMLTMLSGMAGFERDSIIQRSVEGTNRLAREGAWLGGIVPYGYRVEGKNRDARLVVSEQRIPGVDLSEADIIRLIYRRCVELNESCATIAVHLNALGVPPSYRRDGREVLRGKRAEATQGIWRAGRIRNMIVNPVYNGIHRYGMRSKKQREIIEREVPAIVSVETWERAQEKLRTRMIMSRRNATRQYLLRGLIKCGLCGLTYSGTTYPVYHQGVRTYYACNGKMQFRGLYGGQGKKCPSKAVDGERLEAQVWADVEGFLREPDAVLAKLAERAHRQADETEQLRAEIARLQQLAGAKQSEKDTVIALYRRGRIDASDLDRQLDQIQHEDAGLRDAIAHLQERLETTQRAEVSMRSAEAMLSELHTKLGAGGGDGSESLSWELKRQLVEKLVKEIRVETITDEETRKKRANVIVTYRFSDAEVTIAAIGTRTDSSPK